jgi:hypothetical protein
MALDWSEAGITVGLGDDGGQREEHDNNSLGMTFSAGETRSDQVATRCPPDDAVLLCPMIVFAVRRINKLHLWLMNWLFATAITPRCLQPTPPVSDFAVSNFICAAIRAREKTKSERDSLRA